MSEERSPLVLTRRTVLLIAAGGIAGWSRLDAAGGGFWDKKQPSDWTSEEIDKLLGKSPWAKEATATFVPGEGGPGSGPSGRGGSPGGGGYPGGGGIGMPRIGIGGVGIGMPRRGMGGGRGGAPRGGGGRASSYKGTVRWESAKPILEATKTALPEIFANHYVIGVSGFPWMGDGRPRDDDDDSKADGRLDELKQLTTLQAKGKELVQAGVIQRQVSNGTSILFGFSKDLELSKDDREVVFSTRLGRLSLKAKFEPKEMVYHRELAV